ncbi:hypothetical protein KKF82_06205 [Patescibacteria group bacterium]|nr:hypothetical protein [Patescibacteria group bacterium]
MTQEGNMKRLLLLLLLSLLLCVTIAEPTCRAVRVRYRLEGAAQTYAVYDDATALYTPYAQSPTCAPQWTPPHAGFAMVVWTVRCGRCLGG